MARPGPGEAIRPIGTRIEGGVDGIGFPADPDDGRVLVCGLAGRADVIVTADREDLLPAGACRGTPAVSPPDPPGR